MLGDDDCDGDVSLNDDVIGVMIATLSSCRAAFLECLTEVALSLAVFDKSVLTSALLCSCATMAATGLVVAS
jgi:hypothetical protein